MDNEEKIRKELITEMIMDILYNSLKKCSKGIRVENYRIDEENVTYLLKKYDSKKFKEYEEMLMKGKTDDE